MFSGAVVVHVPHVFDDLRFGDHLSGVAHEVLQYGELPRGEDAVDIAASASPCTGVNLQVSRRQQRGSAGCAPANERSQVGEQHNKTERFREVVVGAGVQRLRLVVLAGLGGQHQDRCPDVEFPKATTDLVPADAGQHDVEDDGVVGHLTGEEEALVSGMCDIDREAVGL